MTTVFINGGTPSNSADSYGGFLANTTEQILTEIQSKMLTVVPAWTTTLDNISTTGVLEMSSGGGVNSQIRVQFTKEVDGNPGHASHRIKIRVRRLDGAGGTLVQDYSPDATHYVEVDEGNLNRVFANFNEESVAICIIPGTGVSCGVYAGYPERYSPGDGDGLYIGYLINGTVTLPLRLQSQLGLAQNNMVYWMNYVYVSKSLDTATDWFNLVQYYHTVPVTGANQGNIEFPLGLTSDSIGVWENCLTTPSIVSSQSNHTHTYLGAVNGINNFPILERYGWTEGREDRDYGSYILPNGTPSQTPGDAKLRGLLYNTCRGLGAFPPGSQWSDTTGEVYMSCGDYGHQGIRIA